MALVPLTLKDAKPARRARRKVVGIDLGTTNSLVGTVTEAGPRIIPVGAGSPMLPSAVRYGADGEVTVGGEALEALAAAPGEVVTSAKRLMGRERRIAHLADAVSPVEASAEILRALAGVAAKELGGAVEAAVITVPAYFDDAQRQATKDAARLAGLEVLRLLNEPTAAALAYGLENEGEGVYVVYDLGGGTFDVSILRLSRGVFEVLGTGGDSALGGDDYDAKLASLALREAGLEEPDHASSQWRRLLQRARAAKVELTSAASAKLQLDAKRAVTIAREQFYDATKELTARTLAILAESLAAAGANELQLDGVIMVGGSSRMPQLHAAVAAAIDAPLLSDIDPDTVVALGAAAQADILAGNRAGDDWLLLDVTPLSLGIEIMGGLVERIIPRNSAIPITRAQEFTNHAEGQSGMVIHVVQGERELASDCRSLARFSLKGIPPMAAGTARIRVSYRIDADGLLAVSAKELATDQSATIEIKPSYGLTEDEVADMLRASYAHGKEDVLLRSVVETRGQARSMLDQLAHLLEIDSANAGADLGKITAAREALEELYGLSEDPKAVDEGMLAKLRAAIAALDQASEGFASRRMEAAVRAALAGRDIGEIG